MMNSATAAAASQDAGLGGGEGAAPTETQVRGLNVPYQLHHGDADMVVPLVMDERFVTILRGAGVATELHVYAGASHEDVSRNATALARVRAWYAAYGMF